VSISDLAERLPCASRSVFLVGCGLPLYLAGEAFFGCSRCGRRAPQRDGKPG
jgi:hypothetical protein